MRRPRCYLRSHRWVEKVSDGQSYYQCRDCGKYRDPVRTGLPVIWPSSDRYEEPRR